MAERLGDDESRETLLRLCAFRLGLDLEFSSFLSTEPHYFNALTLPPLQGKAITYIDCGAYNGDTFAAHFRDLPAIVFPRMIRELSSASVLTAKKK